MRKIVNSTFISIDGVVEDPHLWPDTGPDDERSGESHTELVLSCDALIMGRRTYESFSAAWPPRSGDPLSDRINSMRKYVFSSTLKDPEWANTTVVDGDAVQAIRELKDQPGEGILQYGYGPITRAMIANDLLDELRLWVHPLIVGKGGAIYGAMPTKVLKLADATPLSSGTVLLTYTR
jgi:dihydrofolate reductase